jgi:hypothetical protein
MRHILPSSNLMEHLFSRAKFLMCDHQKHMSPFHLDLLLFFRYNYDLRSKVTFDEIIKNNQIIFTEADQF